MPRFFSRSLLVYCVNQTVLDVLTIAPVSFRSSQKTSSTKRDVESQRVPTESNLILSSLQKTENVHPGYLNCRGTSTRVRSHSLLELSLPHCTASHGMALYCIALHQSLLIPLYRSKDSPMRLATQTQQRANHSQYSTLSTALDPSDQQTSPSRQRR